MYSKQQSDDGEDETEVYETGLRVEKSILEFMQGMIEGATRAQLDIFIHINKILDLD